MGYVVIETLLDAKKDPSLLTALDVQFHSSVDGSEEGEDKKRCAWIAFAQHQFSLPDAYARLVIASAIDCRSLLKPASSINLKLSQTLRGYSDHEIVKR